MCVLCDFLCYHKFSAPPHRRDKVSCDIVKLPTTDLQLFSSLVYKSVTALFMISASSLATGTSLYTVQDFHDSTCTAAAATYTGATAAMALARWRYSIYTAAACMRLKAVPIAVHCLHSHQSSERRDLVLCTAFHLNFIYLLS